MVYSHVNITAINILNISIFLKHSPVPLCSWIPTLAPSIRQPLFCILLLLFCHQFFFKFSFPVPGPLHMLFFLQEGSSLISHTSLPWLMSVHLSYFSKCHLCREISLILFLYHIQTKRFIALLSSLPCHIVYIYIYYGGIFDYHLSPHYTLSSMNVGNISILLITVFSVHCSSSLIYHLCSWKIVGGCHKFFKWINWKKWFYLHKDSVKSFIVPVETPLPCHLDLLSESYLLCTWGAQHIPHSPKALEFSLPEIFSQHI